MLSPAFLDLLFPTIICPILKTMSSTTTKYFILVNNKKEKEIKELKNYIGKKKLKILNLRT